MKQLLLSVGFGFAIALSSARAQDAKPILLADQLPNTWIKRSPLKTAPPSPELGYEGALVYDPKSKLIIRWAGHNQGGGGEQNAETWTFDVVTAKWTLKEPNTSPPGACCAQQNVFDPVGGRYLRFPAFSGSHGWHWFRENYLNNSSVWTYDLEKNTWRDMRSVPTPRPAPLRCASWDSDHQVAVVFGGEGGNDGTIVYDPYDNSWKRMLPGKEPKGRSAGNMAYHKALKKHFLFGTQFSDDPHTWVYDLAKNEWTDLKPGVQPPTDKNDAILAYDDNSEMIVASIRVFGQTVGVDEWHYETWVYEHKKNTWKKMNPKVEPPGGGQRRRIMAAIPDQNVILMENYVNPPQKIPGVEREQQMWTYRYGPSRPAPVGPKSLQLETLENGVRLQWDPQSPIGRVTGWWIIRSPGPKPWTTAKTLYWISGDSDTYYVDKNLNGIPFSYSVATIERNDKNQAEIGIRSPKVRVQPRLVEDVIASVHSTTKVTLAWPAAKEADVVGYHVERAPVEVFSEDEILRLRTDTASFGPPAVGAIKSIGKFEKLTKQPIKATTYTDGAIDLMKPVTVKDEIYRHRFGAGQFFGDGAPYRYAVYAYRVRAVNKLGVESGAGPYALTIPSAPQWVFSKEEGTKCHLKWEKNPEHGIAGYHIYRMESPRINGPGQTVHRLTRDPITTPRYLDVNAGKETARYWIVAVDALGQEGYPSAPVWHERQYKKYYAPFTGEWHQ